MGYRRPYQRKDGTNVRGHNYKRSNYNFNDGNESPVVAIIVFVIFLILVMKCSLINFICRRKILISFDLQLATMYCEKRTKIAKMP